MSDLLWVKMPSEWIAKGLLATNLSSSKNVSTDIAALKVYICLCLFSTVVKREHILVSFNPPFTTKTSSYIDQIESCMTYDQLCESAVLSRVLVSRGLNKLEELELIKKEGTTRKKRYVIVGNVSRRWCKLPRKALIKSDNIVSCFTSFTQRYEQERAALKLFLYFLSVRTNSKRYVDVSRGIMSKKTGINLMDLDGCLGFLRSLGLLEDVKSKGYLKLPSTAGSTSEQDRLHRYWVVGNQSLNFKTVKQESEDLDF
ncbi:hypothetical protein ABHN84_12230 [Shewanella vesiculosa]|uniref:MarR family transcriptional regulator n=1 Tax=Shewanella vesiculosa TaxID=518738 RepID=A0ABV0FR15_9GAMM